MTTSTVPSELNDVQARIADIQARMGISPQPATSSSPPSTGGADFQSLLNSVLGVTSGGTSSALPPDTISARDAGGGQLAVTAASQYLGVPYAWGGTDPSSGLDCSGLVQRAYSDIGIRLPRTAAEQARQGSPVSSLSQAQPGDLVAFGSPVDHIGIYAGNNKMVVAPKRGDVVKLEDVYTTPTAIRRIIPSSPAQLGAISGTTLPAALSSAYDALFTQAGAKHNISAALLAAVAKQESGFNATTRSGAGAQGLMQLMPSTAKGLGVNADNPAQAIDGAAQMLSGYIKQFGSVPLALAAYNAGPNAVTRYGGIPPYSETQNYVRNIMSMSNQGGAQ